MRMFVRGSMTIVLSLLMILFLTFCMVLLEGVRNFFLKLEAEQAMELAEFSILSEYQRELYEVYGLFLVDLDYEQGTEQIPVLENRARKYLSQNASECETVDVIAENFRRVTDAEGMAFFDQAVEMMKVESGYKILEELVEVAKTDQGNSLDVGEILSENEMAAQDILDSAVDEKGLPLFDISVPRISFPTINALTESIFGDLDSLSEATINLEERLQKRSLTKGNGKSRDIAFTEMQLFHKYLIKYFQYYGKKQGQVGKEVLQYQLEYLISGHESDRENLKNVMWQIFLLRVSGNYLFYHQDSEKMALAEAEAVAIAAVSGNPVLVKTIKEILLIAGAIECSIQETKAIFAGEKVPVYQEGIFSDLQLGYEEYLYLLLNVTGKKEKIYRAMDIVEMEIREKSGYEHFRLDHCTDCFTLTWDYEFESLFLSIPLINQGKYNNTITKKVFYEN